MQFSSKQIRMQLPVGELSETYVNITRSKIVEWKSFNFFQLPTNHSKISDMFTFENTPLHFVLFESCVRLSIPKRTAFSIEYSFSLKNHAGDLVGTKTFTSTPGKREKEDSSFSLYKALERSVNIKSSILTIVCQLRIAPEAGVSLLSEKSMDNLRLAGASNFFKGLKEIFLSNMYCDFVFNVKGKEFRTHKIVLAARSPVFAAMFQHDMKEKNCNDVNIEDCKLDIFSDFLNFLYTGEIDSLNSDNVVDLYLVADKYQVNELSGFCVKYMVDTISIENILDTLDFGLSHHVKELIDMATKFFLKNAKEIAITAKWMTFMAKNPVAANELFVKALDFKML